jgi:mono/diheme cytochrome c family protein
VKIKTFVFPACAALLLSGCASYKTGNAAAGADLFAIDGCTSCHQINGVGSTKFMNLTQDLAQANFDLLKYELNHPPKGMEIVKSLHFTKAQIRDLNALAVSNQKPAIISMPASAKTRSRSPNSSMVLR